jgi:hypothetical protein
MTDYGSIIDDRDEEEEREREKKRARKAREAERKRVDNEFETHVLKSKPRKTCSANSDLIKFVKHMKTVRTALKAAADDGFCLDEILDGLKELDHE